jgi:hypothetical protein
VPALESCLQFERRRNAKGASVVAEGGSAAGDFCAPATMLIDLASELNATGVQILFVEIGGSHLRQLATVTQPRYFSREES